jgi:hypothetical protein
MAGDMGCSRIISQPIIIDQTFINCTGIVHVKSIKIVLFFIYNEGYFLLDHICLAFAFPLALVIVFIFIFMFIFVFLLGPTVLSPVTSFPAVIAFVCRVLAASARPMSGELAVVAVRGLF